MAGCSPHFAVGTTAGVSLKDTFFLAGSAGTAGDGAFDEDDARLRLCLAGHAFSAGADAVVTVHVNSASGDTDELESTSGSTAVGVCASLVVLRSMHPPAMPSTGLSSSSSSSAGLVGWLPSSRSVRSSGWRVERTGASRAGSLAAACSCFCSRLSGRAGPAGFSLVLGARARCLLGGISLPLKTIHPFREPSRIVSKASRRS